MGKKRNAQFCAELNATYGKEVSLAEKRFLHKEFGPLNVQLSLCPEGFRHLFETLSKEAAQQTLSAE